MKTNATKKFGGDARRLGLERLEERRLLAVDAVSVATAATFDSTVSDETNVPALVASEVPGTDAGANAESDAGANDAWYVLTSSNLNPSAEEQELLEQINRFRVDPQGELKRIFSDVDVSDSTLTARNSLVADAIALYQYPRNSVETFLREWESLEASAPLAFNASLQSAAKSHNGYMTRYGELSHQLKKRGEKDLATRVVAAGFESGLSTDSGTPALSENIAGALRKNGDFSVASFALASFAVDWGVPSHSHRDTTTNAAFSEIGISVSATSKSGLADYVVTCDFGTSVDGARSDGAYLLGVLYDDVDGDAFYDVGEGVGGATITIERLGAGGEEAQTVDITSATAGGYQIFLLNGSYRVTVAANGDFTSAVTKTVSISDGTNAKLDFRTSDASAVAPVVDLNGDADGTGWNAVFVEGSTEALDALKTSSLTIIDADSATLCGAKIAFSTRPDGIDETLDVSVAGTGLSASFSKNGGCVEISGTGTLEEYADALASLTYFNAKELCELTDSVVSISVFDGVFWSDEALLSISIEPTKLPQMTVQESFAYEGDEGAKSATFVVELDAPARVDVSFNVRVAENAAGTASEGEQFSVSIGDPITIAKGETSATIEYFVLGNFDALKPQGLAAVEGGFENPSTSFYLEIVDLTGAYLTNESALAKGTIYDDDSPIILGTTDEYAFANALSTDDGRRRYVFTLTPTTSGLFGWSAESLGLPDGLKISVKAGSLDSAVIASSDPTDAGQKAQWFADPTVEYWITVECADDFDALAARLLPIDENGVVLVDPLLAASEDKTLSLFWGDGGADAGNGAGLNVGVDGFDWNFGSDYLAQLPNGPTFKTNDYAGLADANFGLGPGVVGTVDASSDSGDDTTVWRGDESTGGGIVAITGFDVTYWGEDKRESLTFVGSDGDDYLYYSDGSGYFTVGGTKTCRFKNVNSVVVDGGSGGNDVAYLEDAKRDETLTTTNDSTTLAGSGFSLTAKNFTDLRVAFVNGGTNSYCATDSGDDVSALVATSCSIVSGTFGGTDESGDANGETSGESSVAKRSYRRIVSNASSVEFAPTTTLASLTVCGTDSSGTVYDAQVGSVVSSDLASGSSLVVRRAKSATIRGVPATSDSRLVVALPNGEYEKRDDGEFVTIVDADGWSLSVPSWKELDETSSAALPLAESNDDALDAAFAVWSDDESLEVAAVDFDGAALLASPTFDAFATLNDVSEQLNKRWRKTSF